AAWVSWSVRAPGHDGEPRAGSQSLTAASAGQPCCRPSPAPVRTGAPSPSGAPSSLAGVVGHASRGWGGTPEARSRRQTAQATRANPNNANTARPLASGRPEINWDRGGGGDAPTDPAAPLDGVPHTPGSR